MPRRRHSVLLALLVALGMVAGLTVRADVAAANGCPLRIDGVPAGTEADPLLVPDRAALEVVASDSRCYESQYAFKQTADIDLSGADWTPIAMGSGFNGSYDGGGHRITGMTVESGADVIGLFSQLSGATVNDLVISGARVTRTAPGYGVGVLAGAMTGASITRVRVLNSTVVGVDNVGGLVGGACYSQINASSSEASVWGSVSVGGLIGVAMSRCFDIAGGLSAQALPPLPTITDSAATGPVSGETQVGGLIGDMDPMVVSRSFATGVVTSGTGSAGGLIGRLRGVVINTVIAPSNPSTLVDVYSTGAVSGGSGVGGLIGQLESGATVTRAYSVGRVTGGGAGGLVGGAYLGCVGIEASCGISRISGVPTAVTPTSFWNTITSGQATSYGEIASGRTTTQLQTLGTYADAGWTIARGWSDPTATTWGICPSANGGYPFLQSQYTAAAQPCAGLPAVPRGVKATTGDGRVTVTWQAPASDGGSPITSYVATAVMQKASAKAAPSCSPAAGATSCTITGLRNGRAYRIALTAANIEGTGAAATVLATPRVGLIVLSTQRSGLAIVSKVRVVSAGRLTQVGTATGLSGKACRVTAQPKQAGVLMVRCPLTARAQQALIGGPLTVVSTLRFRPTSGTVRQAVRTVRFAQTDAAVTVTG